MKVAVISGASGNLGKAVVKYFLNHSYQVIGLVHSSKQGKDTIDNYQEIVVDLMDEKATHDCVAVILENNKNIDVVVLTAGGFKSGKLENTFVKDLESQYRLNFLTAFNLARPIFLQMKNQENGRLFFIGSQPGMDTRKGMNNVAYSLSKSQLFQLANIFNAETDDLDIKTFVVVPSTIDTPENRKSMPNADYSKWEKPKAIAEIIGRYAKIPNTTSSKSTLMVQEEMH